MAEAILVLSVINTTITVVTNCWSLSKQIKYILDYQSDLESLKNTLCYIRAMLLDAEAKQRQEELSYEAQHWMVDVKNAVYDVDDLLDEFYTYVQNKLEPKNGFNNKVQRLLARFSHLGVSFRMYKGAKKISKHFDSISGKHTQYGFTFNKYKAVKRTREETTSFVPSQGVIGRDKDRDEIVNMLLGSDRQFVTIVGVGGVGKTTLAQLVYNHEEIVEEFEKRHWVCVADVNQKHFDMNAILRKILESSTGQKAEDVGKDQLQKKVREQMEEGSGKYLIVLDDVWNENRHEWVKLREIFAAHVRILVTTRSKEVARVIGDDGKIHELQGLSDDDSWNVFKAVAFKQEQNQTNHPDHFVEIAQQIHTRCANNPLALRVVGSYLYGHGITKWRTFQKQTTATTLMEENAIVQNLRFSYDQLSSPLKHCFKYCALFPKGHVLKKEMLIDLWMAQGYIMPVDEDQSFEDVGDEYFSILLQRGFLQKVKKDDYGYIVSCEMHTLLHDVSQVVAGKEICAGNANFVTRNSETETRHLNQDGGTLTEEFISELRLRSYLQSGKPTIPVEKLLKSWGKLRSLDLHDLDIQEVPDSIGDLLHLRYLDLSSNGNLKAVPSSIHKLYNLQTLNLSHCSLLKGLPENFCQLVKLRHLYLTECFKLTTMPSGMNNLTNLQVLTNFAVAEDNSRGQLCSEQLEDLIPLQDLRGHLTISIHGASLQRKRKRISSHSPNYSYLSNKEHLRDLIIKWEAPTRNDKQFKMLEGLKPHPNIKGLTLEGYTDAKLPRWAAEDALTSLPNLVKNIQFVKCREFK